MQRMIKFSKFRNIGLEKDECLVLNSDFRKGKMGNLIILIGANNSGKSNVLDGIVKSCGREGLSNRDVTNLSFEEKYRNPSLSLMYCDDKYTFELKTEIGKAHSWKVTSGEVAIAKPTAETVKEEMKSIYSFCLNSYGIRFQPFVNLVSNIENKTIKNADLYNQALEALSILYKNRRNNYQHNNICENLDNSNYQIVKYFKEKNGMVDSFVHDYFIDNIDADVYVPKCIVYRENPINNSDLSIARVSDLENSRFFKSLFAIIGVDIKTVQNTYSQFNQTGNILCLKKLQKDVQKELNEISDNFNGLYFASDDQYKFSIEFESNKIWFGMARGKNDDPINLEYQSTGFRWFFNFFFNFLVTDSLEPGNIVIMDEPATNLHVQGQRELRSFIKSFAIATDVLFVLATHSPFLIDVDHYDELRVISTDNNRSRIDNRFSAVNLDDSDSLLPIKESLTIQQNVLYDLDTEVYFVEGITDYNYLTMFKKLLDVKNIAFLPFNGVGNNSAQTKAILERLVKIRFHKRSLLVDNDRAGKDMYKQAQEAAFDSIHRMSEVKISDTKEAMMVEDLFSFEDKKKYPAIGNKSSDGTSVMKDHCKLSDFSKTTVDHFKELFRILQE